MEHLSLPHGVDHFIVAPYEAPCSAWYDNKCFLTFPQRRGWTEEQIRGEDDTHGQSRIRKTPNETEQFFQTWLFFGLAIEVLKIGKVHVTTEDFLKPRGTTNARIIDTSKLPAFLVQWENGLRTRNDLSSVWEEVNAMFEKVALVLERFCPRMHEIEIWPLNEEEKEKRTWPVRDEISTTMIALGFSLRAAAIDVCNPPIDNPSDPWPAARSEILAKRLQRKACIADVTTTLKQLPIDGQYFLAGSPGIDPDELDHHSKCVRAHCLYDYDLDMYVTKHATSSQFHRDHKGACRTEINYGGQLGPERGQTDWVDAICRIIDKDAIPIALWVKGLQQLFSVEYHLCGTRKPDYVAISHVWADGKGNPGTNALPECQIDRIQRLVEMVTWEGRKEVPSNPKLSNGVGFWMDTLCLPAVDKARKDKAIDSMRHVYSHAKAVLVLDEWLQTMKSDAPPLEVTARLYQSSWLKRLWTHQEGYLPPALWFQFSDRPVEIKELDTRLSEHQKSLKALGMHLVWPENANLRLVELYNFLGELFKLTKDEKDKWILYEPLAAAMSERKTSRLADEILCLATIVDINLQPFLKIPSKPDEKSAEKRMALFLRQLGRFQTGIIFNNYERLSERGYKWAPRSLLNLRTADMGYSDTNETNFEPVNGQMGLLVQYPGFLVRFTTNGRLSLAAAERSCAIYCKGVADTDATTSARNKWFVVELPPNKVVWTTNKTYAVLISELPQRRGQHCAALLAWSNTGFHNGVYTVDHESIARVRVQETQPSWVDTVEAHLLSRNTKWLVV